MNFNPTRPGTLVSRSEIKDILEVKKQRVAVLVQRPDFPRPVDVLQNGRMPVWKRESVVRWKEERDAAGETELDEDVEPVAA